MTCDGQGRRLSVCVGLADRARRWKYLLTMAGIQKYTDHDDPKDVFKRLYNEAKALGLSEKDWIKLESLRNIKKSSAKKSKIFTFVNKFLFLILSLLATGFFIIVTEWPVSNEKILSAWFKLQDLEPNQEQCLVEMNEFISDYVRPPVNCSFCEGVAEIDRISNITRQVFEEKYAYSGRPVIIEGATANWTAMNIFSFHFFKKLYAEDSPTLINVDDNCQFFPYRTEFDNLGEVFNMSEDRVVMKNGFKPWYIGW